MGEVKDRVYLEMVKELREGLPKILTDVGVAVLVWVFSMYVFIPLSKEYALLGMPLPQLISLVALIAIAAVAVGLVRTALKLIDSVAAYMAYEVGSGHRAREEEVNSYRSGLRGIFYVLVASLLFLFFKDFLSVFHPAISALALFILAVWAVITLVRAGRSFSRLAEFYASEWVALLEKRAKKEG
ncbi:MAG: hypothetical protein NZ954_06940 [Thermofilaceae archaeon]|nr:hypothetical protein [Thermofilaceae archaeon]MCX8179756.1 hypothetical protein [Thermofilaceae archaeon]MDW8004284.1 hypothetical protein [Thermofilaceae archaeon]